MAKVLSSFEFPASVVKGKYSWSEWADGKIREFKAGEDFTCQPGALVGMARSYAKKNGLTLRASAKKDSDVVVLQFVKAAPPAANKPADKPNKRKSA